MPGIREIADVADLSIKAAIAVGTFFIYTQAEKQADYTQKMAEASAKMADASAKMAEAKQTTQSTNLAIVDKLLNLFSDIRKDCLSDDRLYMADFLVEVNNKYNAVQFDGTQIHSILVAQQHCESPDATAVQKTSLGAGKIPIVTTENIQQLNKSLQPTAPVKAIASEAELPDGYVALGAPANQNFTIASSPEGATTNIVAQTLLKAKWSVYLRSNTENTEAGGNAIRGLIRENQCVRVLQPYPGIRGQTWAAVKLAECT